MSDCFKSDNMSELDTRSNPCSPGQRVRFVTQRPMEVEIDSIDYNMSRNVRKAVIFNHNKFSRSLKKRPGTENDVKQLQIVLDLFNFTVTVHEDLKRSDLFRKLEELGKADHNDCDCLAIFVLTHGAVNRLAAEDKIYNPEELWSNFSSEACPTMAGKPKLIFINACRGDDHDFGTEFVSDLTIDTEENNDINNYQLVYTLPTYADILVAYSTYHGYISHRPAEGSWFIQALCEILMENKSKKVEFKHLLTRVTQKVALMVHHRKTKQIPVVISTLTRDLYLS